MRQVGKLRLSRSREEIIVSGTKKITREEVLTSRQAVTLSTAAGYLGVSHKTLRRLISDGKLPAYRVGGGPIRVLISDVEALKEPIRAS
jgi:excisionase family DNA binding protein